MIQERQWFWSKSSICLVGFWLARDPKWPFISLINDKQEMNIKIWMGWIKIDRKKHLNLISENMGFKIIVSISESWVFLFVFFVVVVNESKETKKILTVTKRFILICPLLDSIPPPSKPRSRILPLHHHTSCSNGYDLHITSVPCLYLFGWRNQVLPSLWVSFVSIFVLQPRHRWRTYQKPQILGQVKVQFFGWSLIKLMFVLISWKILINQKNVHKEKSRPRSYLPCKKKFLS